MKEKRAKPYFARDNFVILKEVKLDFYPQNALKKKRVMELRLFIANEAALIRPQYVLQIAYKFWFVSSRSKKGSLNGF